MLVKNLIAYAKPHFPKGISGFLIIWFGQAVSLIGSELTSFAFGVWVYQRHQIVSEFALIFLFSLLPTALLSPIAGFLSDRWDRRRVMILSDTGAALSTLGVLLLLAMGKLEVWHIYLATFFGAVFQAFQWPAYAAATTMLVPAQSLGLANGLIQLGEAFAQLLTPPLAGVLLVLIQLKGIIAIDFITFFLALLTLSLVQIPPPLPQEGSESQSGNFWVEMFEGWNYIIKCPSLLKLMFFLTADNFLTGFVAVLVTPLALSFTTPAILGMIMSIGGVGMVIGSLVMTRWGGPRKYIDGVLIFNFLSGLAIFGAGWHTSVPLLSLCSFVFFFSLPIINGCSQVIWQKKVAPEIQGRVFAIERMFAWSFLAVAYPSSGFLADKIFEPLMASNGFWAQSIGLVIGTGPGRGIGLMFIVVGFMSLILTAFVGSNPTIRKIG